MKIEKLFDRLQVGEHASRKLRVTLESELADYEACLVFLTPEGKNYVSGSLSFTDGTAEYALPGALTDGPGLLLAQLAVCDGEEFVRKSPVQEYVVFPSVETDGVNNLEDMGDLNDPSRFYLAFLTHAHDDLYYRRAELDALLEGKADKNVALTAGTDREAYLNDTLLCIASYLVREADSDCVSQPFGTDLFAAEYNNTGRSYLHLYNQGADSFTWDERAAGGRHKLFCNDAGFLALITKCRDYPSSPYKKAFDQLDCHIVGGGCTVFDKNGSYSLGDRVLYQGKAYRCQSATTGSVFDPRKWTELTVSEFSLSYMRYEETVSYAVGDYALLDGSLYRCVTAASNEAWDPAKWEFIRGGLTLEDSVLLAFSAEKGSIHEKPYTMDFRNLIYPHYMAFIQDHSGDPLKSILKREAVGGSYQPAAVSSAENLRQLEDGDLLFFSRPQSGNYRRISHCGYYLSSLDRLNAVGASEYGGITFSAVDHGTNSGPEWGYVVECAEPFPAGSGRNTIRISTLKGMMNHSGTENPYAECFYSKPYANPFNSTKVARLLSFASSADDRLWFGNRFSDPLAADPDGVPCGSYWLQPDDGNAHLHTVTAASLGAEGRLLSHLLPHGEDYQNYSGETLDIDFIRNGVYRCDCGALADRLTDGNGSSRLPAGLKNDEKTFLLVQMGGVEEEDPREAHYGVQMLFPLLVTNGTVYLRFRKEGYYDTEGQLVASGGWGAWKKIVTFDGIPLASASVAGLAKVGNGLTASGGTVSIDPNGSFTAQNIGVTGGSLASNADLDTLGNGVWRCDSSALAATIQHLPPVDANSTDAFTVLEYGAYNSHYGVQIFVTNPSGILSEIFTRHRGAEGAWGVWQKQTTELKPTSWEQVQAIVRMGIADKVFSIGDQLTCQRNGVTLTWDVIGFDHETPQNVQLTHSMTLQLHDVYKDLQFDAREAFYYASQYMPAGTYYFKVGVHPYVSGDVNKYIKFTTTVAVPAGGQLVFTQAYNATLVGGTIKSYSSRTSTTALETVTMSEGSSGTNLGTINNTKQSGLNSMMRALLGNNNCMTSAVQQLINSHLAAGHVWQTQNQWDRPPAWAATEDGFLCGIDEDFLSVIGTVIKKTVRNGVCDDEYHAGLYDSDVDRFFLLAREEVYAGKENSMDEGSVYPYYRENSSLSAAGTGADSNRIKYLNGTAKNWWLRTPDYSSAFTVRYVYSTGEVYASGASNSFGVAPACSII